MAFLAAIPALMASAAGAAGAAGAATTAATAASSAISWGSGLAAAGGLMGGVSSFMQSRYQAQVANHNAQLLNAQADNSRKAGQTAESAQRMKTGELVGQQMAAQGANGVDTGVGSTTQVRAATQTLGDFNADMIRYNASKEAWGQDAQAMDQRNQAAMDKRKGTLDLISSFVGAAGSIAGGVGKLASNNMMNSSFGLPSGSWTFDASALKAGQNLGMQP